MDKVRLENLERLKKISKETNFIFSNFEDINKENIIAILSSDETKRRAVFMALINIQENLEKAIKSNDTEIAALFSQEDLERIKQTRNVAAHDSGAMKFYKVANLIRFDLIRIRDNSLRFIESQSLKEKVENIEVKVIENKKDFLTKIAIGLGVAVIFALGILFFVLANKLGIFGASVDNLIYSILFIVSGLILCGFLLLFNNKINKLTPENVEKGIENFLDKYGTRSTSSSSGDDYIMDPKYSCLSCNIYHNEN